MKCTLSVLLLRKGKFFEKTIDLSISPFVGLHIQFPKYMLKVRFVKHIVSKKQPCAVCEFDWKKKGDDKEKLLKETGWKQAG